MFYDYAFVTFLFTAVEGARTPSESIELQVRIPGVGFFALSTWNERVATLHVFDCGGYFVPGLLASAVAAVVSGVEGEATGGTVPDEHALFLVGVVAVAIVGRG